MNTLEHAHGMSQSCTECLVQGMTKNLMTSGELMVVLACLVQGPAFLSQILVVSSE